MYCCYGIFLSLEIKEEKEKKKRASHYFQELCFFFFFFCNVDLLSICMRETNFTLALKCTHGEVLPHSLSVFFRPAEAITVS